MAYKATWDDGAPCTRHWLDKACSADLRARNPILGEILISYEPREGSDDTTTTRDRRDR